MRKLEPCEKRALQKLITWLLPQFCTMLYDYPTFSSFFFSIVGQRMGVHLYYNNMIISVFLSVCTLIAISKPIWMPFGTKLLFAPGKALKQQYLVKLKIIGKMHFLFSNINKILILLWLQEGKGNNWCIYYFIFKMVSYSPFLFQLQSNFYARWRSEAASILYSQCSYSWVITIMLVKPKFVLYSQCN